MPLYCSTTGSTAFRDAEVQQPMIAATLSLTSSFLAFSAKVGQSLAPSSWMNLILRPRMLPALAQKMGEEAWSRQESPPFPSAAFGEKPTAAPVCCRLTYLPHSCSRTRYWRGKDH